MHPSECCWGLILVMVCMMRAGPAQRLQHWGPCGGRGAQQGSSLPRRSTKSRSGRSSRNRCTMLLISSPSLACFTARVMARHTFCTRTWRAVANVRSPPRCLRKRIRAAWRAPSSLAAAISSCSAVSMSKGAIVAAHERRYEAKVSRASGENTVCRVQQGPSVWLSPPARRSCAGWSPGVDGHSSSPSVLPESRT